jgi:hypothetical protein
MPVQTGQVKQNFPGLYLQPDMTEEAQTQTGHLQPEGFYIEVFSKIQYKLYSKLLIFRGKSIFTCHFLTSCG